MKGLHDVRSTYLFGNTSHAYSTYSTLAYLCFSSDGESFDRISSCQRYSGSSYTAFPPRCKITGSALKMNKKLDQRASLVSCPSAHRWCSSGAGLVLSPDATHIEHSTDGRTTSDDVTLVVAVIQDPPFVVLDNGSATSGEGLRASGLDIDVLDILAQNIKFSYQLLKVEETAYGDSVNGTWTGLLGSLQRKEAHLVLPTISDTVMRSSIMDISAPVSSSISQFMIRRPPPTGCGLGTYLLPFSAATWFVALSFGVVALLSLVASDTCHLVWGRRKMASQPYQAVADSFFSVLGGATQQGMVGWSGTPSIRVTLHTWNILCVMLMGCYSSVLISYLTVETYRLPFTSMEELLDNGEYRVGYVRGSAYDELLKVHAKQDSGNSSATAAVQDDFYRLYRKANEHPSNLVANNGEGIRRVLGNTKYAFLSWLGGMLYEIGAGDCRFVFIGKHLMRRYGIAFAKGSPYVDKVSLVLLRLQEGGVLRRLHKIHFPNSGNYQCRSMTSRHPIDLHRVLTIFIMLFGGYILALFFLLLELGHNWWKKRSIKLMKCLES